MKTKHLVGGAGHIGPRSAWSEQEIALLRKVYPYIFPEEIPFIFPRRTIKSVIEKGKAINLRRTERHVIYPRTYSNDIDGGYVSGLIDGEGWFMVSIKRRENGVCNYNPKFGINLRHDDSPILDWLKSYFDCGIVRHAVYRGTTSKPAVVYSINDLFSIMRCVLPHFDCYPLRAKKKIDYATWKDMVVLQSKNYRKYWSDAVRSEMERLYEKLRTDRRYPPAGPGSR